MANIDGKNTTPNTNFVQNFSKTAKDIVDRAAKGNGKSNFFIDSFSEMSKASNELASELANIKSQQETSGVVDLVQLSNCKRVAQDTIKQKMDQEFLALVENDTDAYGKKFNMDKFKGYVTKAIESGRFDVISRKQSNATDKVDQMEEAGVVAALSEMSVAKKTMDDDDLNSMWALAGLNNDTKADAATVSGKNADMFQSAEEMEAFYRAINDVFGE